METPINSNKVRNYIYFTSSDSHGIHNSPRRDIFIENKSRSVRRYHRKQPRTTRVDYRERAEITRLNHGKQPRTTRLNYRERAEITRLKYLYRTENKF